MTENYDESIIFWGYSKKNMKWIILTEFEYPISDFHILTDTSIKTQIISSDLKYILTYNHNSNSTVYIHPEPVYPPQSIYKNPNPFF